MLVALQMGQAQEEPQGIDLAMTGVMPGSGRKSPRATARLNDVNAGPL